MKITVTDDDIALGRRGTPDACPVALALAEAVPDWIWLVRGPDVTGYSRQQLDSKLPPSAHVIPLPTLIQVLVSDFDQGVELEPFEFELDLEPHLTGSCARSAVEVMA